MLLLTIFSELFCAKTCQRQCQRCWEFVGLHTCFMDRLQGHHSYRRAAAYVVVELGIPKKAIHGVKLPQQFHATRY